MGVSLRVNASHLVAELEIASKRRRRPLERLLTVPSGSAACTRKCGRIVHQPDDPFAAEASTTKDETTTRCYQSPEYKASPIPGTVQRTRGAVKHRTGEDDSPGVCVPALPSCVPRSCQTRGSVANPPPGP